MHTSICVKISKLVIQSYILFGELHLILAGPHGLGGECSDNFETGSRSAVAGGTTTIITFATQTREEEDRSLLKVAERYNARAEETGSYVDYGFHIIIVRNDADILQNELPVLMKDWGISSCKLFLTYATQRLSDSQMLDVMFAARKNSITTVNDICPRDIYSGRRLIWY